MKDLKEYRLFSELRALYASTEEYRRTVRFMFRLKDKINVASLTYAIKMVQKRYPYYCVELKKDDNGLYFIKNDRDIILADKNKDILLNSEESNYHLISFQYNDDNYIIINLSHALADGVATYSLIRTLLYYYITNAYNVVLSKENIRLVEDEISEEEFNDPLVTTKKLMTLPKIKLNPALNIIKENHLENQEKFIYHLEIVEKELMDYVKSIKATPGTLISLLLSKALKKENANSKNVVRMSICVDLRKLLDTPLAHQSLVSGLVYDYDEKFDNLTIEEEIKKIRETVSDFIKEPKSLFIISSCYYYLLMLSKEKDINKARMIAAKNKETMGDLVSGVISYVGKANFGDAEKYITDFRTETDCPSPILVEIAAVNGKFYLDFIQNFKDEKYINAFKKEMDELKIKYEVKDLIKLDLPRMKSII
jgi:hypothetical protein